MDQIILQIYFISLLAFTTTMADGFLDSAIRKIRDCPLFHRMANIWLVIWDCWRWNSLKYFSNIIVWSLGPWLQCYFIRHSSNRWYLLFIIIFAIVQMVLRSTVLKVHFEPFTPFDAQLLFSYYLSVIQFRVCIVHCAWQQLISFDTFHITSGCQMSK